MIRRPRVSHQPGRDMPGEDEDRVVSAGGQLLEDLAAGYFPHLSQPW